VTARITTRGALVPCREPRARPCASARSAWRAITQMLAFVAKTFFD